MKLQVIDGLAPPPPDVSYGAALVRRFPSKTLLAGSRKLPAPKVTPLLQVDPSLGLFSSLILNFLGLQIPEVDR